MTPSISDLFGGSRPWRDSDWTASDDRVRGGQSQSHLRTTGHVGRFHGTLDIETLGGAGFASQRTAGDQAVWNLSMYDGVLVRVAKSDGKRYTLILKDKLLPPNPDNGREQSTTSYEYDFEVPSGDARDLYIPWSSFKATYRGKEQKGVEPLDSASIKRFSIMMRSFFGSQQGPFDLSVTSISAYKTAKEADTRREDSQLEAGPPIIPPGAPRRPRAWSLCTAAAAILVTAVAGYVCYCRFLAA